jgi:hypothetical protein
VQYHLLLDPLPVVVTVIEILSVPPGVTVTLEPPLSVTESMLRASLKLPFTAMPDVMPVAV